MKQQYMFNKINQHNDPHRNRRTFSRNKKNNGKITQFVVNKMIKQQSSIEMNNHYSSYVLTNIVPKSSQQPQHKQSISLKRDYIRTQQAEPRLEYIPRHSKTRTRWYCQPSLDTDISTQAKKKSIKNYKVVMADRPQQFRKAIADRIKKIVRSNARQNNGQNEDSLRMGNFGLNISQIKAIDTPKQQLKQERIKEKEKKIVTRESSNKTDCFLDESCNILSRKKTTSGTPACNNKDLMIRKLDEALRYKKGKSRLITEQISSFQKKMFKMFDCLDLVLNSFHCKILPKQQNQENEVEQNKGKKEKQRYYYYIGGGNNSNLVRSLMRKRGWWVEVNNIAKAHFVWSQLRIPSVIDRLQAFNDESWVTTVIPYEEEQTEVPESPGNLKTSKRTNSTLFSQAPKARESSLNLIFHDRQHKRYHTKLDPKQSQLRLQKIHVPELLHNHYEHNYMFGNKNALYYNLSQYYRFVKKDVADVVPLTFYLEKGNRKTFLEFEKVFNQPKRKDNIWILKPAQNSNRGMGIELSNSLSFIRSELSSAKKLIVQSYLKNILLYNYRKFDIRTYMICLTINGRHKFYWYEEGYIRTASEPYDLQNLKDQLIHLTNDAVQKNGQNYGKYQDGNKLNYSEFQRYLDHKFPRSSWQMSSLHQKMKLLAIEAIKATYSRIDSSRKKYGFQLFGLDFIIDNQFKPYLIEINTNPCLELCSRVLERLIPRMMENMFRICVDPLFRPSIDHFYSKNESYYLYDESFLDRNRFTLMFDQKYDCDFEWEERCQKLRGWQWSECQAEEFMDEGSIILVDY